MKIYMVHGINMCTVLFMLCQAVSKTITVWKRKTETNISTFSVSGHYRHSAIFDGMSQCIVTAFVAFRILKRIKAYFVMFPHMLLPPLSATVSNNPETKNSCATTMRSKYCKLLVTVHQSQWDRYI